MTFATRSCRPSIRFRASSRRRQSGCWIIPRMSRCSRCGSLPKRAEVPPATMTRLAQRLGFDGFEPLRKLYADAVRGRADTFKDRAEGLLARREHGWRCGIRRGYAGGPRRSSPVAERSRHGLDHQPGRRSDRPAAPAFLHRRAFELPGHASRLLSAVADRRADLSRRWRGRHRRGRSPVPDALRRGSRADRRALYARHGGSGCLRLRTRRRDHRDHATVWHPRSRATRRKRSWCRRIRRRSCIR